MLKQLDLRRSAYSSIGIFLRFSSFLKLHRAHHQQSSPHSRFGGGGGVQATGHRVRQLAGTGPVSSPECRCWERLLHKACRSSNCQELQVVPPSHVGGGRSGSGRGGGGRLVGLAHQQVSPLAVMLSRVKWDGPTHIAARQRCFHLPWRSAPHNRQDRFLSRTGSGNM